MKTEYEIIENAIRYIEKNYRDQPSLDEVAAFVGLSSYHFQRLFTRWAGISPKKFLRHVTLTHAKSLIHSSRSLLSLSLETGLSSASRLYDLFVSIDAVTPGTYKNRGKGLHITYGVNETPFGEGIIALTERGLSDFRFINGYELDEVEKLHKKWPKATLIRNDEKTQEIVRVIFPDTPKKEPLKLYLSGTPFQVKVWQALLKIPEGYLLSYGDISRFIDIPNASRAVGTAIGQNPLHYIIPCHRVLREDGQIGGYAAGTARKRAILLKELPWKEEQ